MSTRPPRGPRCRCGCDAPSNESWTAQLHARTRQRPPATWVASGWAAQISSNPPPDGRAWEDGWPVSAIPKLVIRSGRGLGVFPHASSRACSRPRGEGALCALPAWISVARPVAPFAQDDGRDRFFSSYFAGQQPPAGARLRPVCVGVHHHPQPPAAPSHSWTIPSEPPVCRRRASRRRRDTRFLRTGSLAPFRVIRPYRTATSSSIASMPRRS